MAAAATLMGTGTFGSIKRQWRRFRARQRNGRQQLADRQRCVELCEQRHLSGFCEPDDRLVGGSQRLGNADERHRRGAVCGRRLPHQAIHHSYCHHTERYVRSVEHDQSARRCHRRLELWPQYGVPRLVASQATAFPLCRSTSSGPPTRSTITSTTAVRCLPAFVTLVGLTGQAQQNGYAQVSGEGGSGSTQTTAYAAISQFMGTILEPSNQGGVDGSSAGATGYADEGERGAGLCSQAPDHFGGA